jgi:hypothetical protein
MNTGIVGYSVAKNTLVKHCYAVKGTASNISNEMCTFADDISTIAKNINDAAEEIAQDCGVSVELLCKYVIEDGKLVLENK